MRQIIKEFAAEIAEGEIEIYNEFSLQHEFGIYLRSKFPNMKIQFERPVSFFFSRTNLNFIKREIDISVFSQDKTNKEAAFELKFPRNGQYPEQMFSFCKDICFIEQLKQAGFKATYFIVFADDRLFYEGSSEGIYGFFRGKKDLRGTIQKPTGKKDETVKISGKYTIVWHTVTKEIKYGFVET
ncbi:MAG: hypothetical protein QXX08_08880 [Candidatus Bathyarchaeia archaeon]